MVLTAEPGAARQVLPSHTGACPIHARSRRFVLMEEHPPHSSRQHFVLPVLYLNKMMWRICLKSSFCTSFCWFSISSMGFSGMWARIFFLLAQKIRAHQQSKEVIPFESFPQLSAGCSPRCWRWRWSVTLSLARLRLLLEQAKLMSPAFPFLQKRHGGAGHFLFCRGLPCLRRQRWDRAGRHYAENSARYRHRDAHRRRTAPDRGRPGGRLRPERAPVPSSAHPLCQRDCLHLPSLLYHRRDR